jgi:pyruvate dehydrogenase (quinone)
MPTVAETIVATLRKNDVQRVYGLPGDSLNGFTDAIRKDGTISWEHVRHEEAAAFAAAATSPSAPAAAARATCT